MIDQSKNSLKLTPKQEKFCHIYIETGDKSEAYRRSYNCLNMKSESINVQAVKLFDNPKITLRVKQLQEDLRIKSDIKKEEVLNQLSAILESKITDYVIFNGRTIKFKAFDQLSGRQIMAIESIKKGKSGIELKLHGKSWSIERICKMLGYESTQNINLQMENLSDSDLDKVINRLTTKK